MLLWGRCRRRLDWGWCIGYLHVVVKVYHRHQICFFGLCCTSICDPKNSHRDVKHTCIGMSSKSISLFVQPTVWQYKESLSVQREAQGCTMITLCCHLYLRGVICMICCIAAAPSLPYFCSSCTSCMAAACFVSFTLCATAAELSMGVLYDLRLAAFWWLLCLHLPSVLASCCCAMC